jgi:hypothetical protein
VSPARRITAGKIVYQTTSVANPSYRGGRSDLFSDELRARIRRQNVPEQREVYFDDGRSRSQEINVDYGIRSASFELRISGRDTVTYCKEFPHFNFCIAHHVELPTGGRPPHFESSNDMATVTGLRCRKGEYQGSRNLLVWYTDDITVYDPTGAVLRLEGVPGLILQTEEIAESDNVDALERVTVTELSFDAPPPEIFSVPSSYLQFDDIDAVRLEDRRMLDVKSSEELRRRPLTVDEQDSFVGEWLLELPEDRILLEITRTGENEFRFRTSVLSAPAHVGGRVSDEKACMKGRLLLVEEPPNYRLYKLTDGGRSLTQVGNDLFTFSRR